MDYKINDNLLKILDYNLMERFKSDDGIEFVRISSLVNITITMVSDNGESVDKNISQMERMLGIDIIYNLK